MTKHEPDTKKEPTVPREKSFLTRIREALPHMHRAEKKLGKMLCDFPGELASYSAAELAELAGVSNATVSRFVRRIGYASYEEARVNARQEKEIGSRLYLATPTSSPFDRRSLDLHFDHYSTSLERTAADIDDVTIDAIVDSILSARRVWTIGFRASQSFATYLRWQFLKVLELVDAIPGGGQTMAEHIVSFRETDLAIVFGLRRRVAETDAIVAEIIRKGTKVLYVTDEGAPFRSDVTWHLRCSTNSPGLLFNHVGVMALCHLLVDVTITRAEASGRKRLREIENIHDALGEI